MGHNTTSNDAFGRGAAPAANSLLLSKDRFKERAEKLAARKGAKAAGDAFATRPAAVKETIRIPIEAPMAAIDDIATKPAPQGKIWTLANGAALQVVSSQPAVAGAEILRHDGKRLERRAARSSSFVLVSSSSVVEAPVIEGGQGELVMPSLPAPKPKVKPKKTGGGGGGNGGGKSGGGADAAAPRDRVFNQDDLAGVLVVLGVLLLLGLYLVNLLKGNGPTAAAEDPVLDVQSASVAPAAPLAPLPDPFGNQAVDLTPKSAPPPESAEVDAAPAPPPAPEPTVAPAAAVAPAVLEVRAHAYFCTDRSELTPVSAEALDKEIAAWGSRMAGKDLVVAGYADTRGEAIYNTWLGGERAKTVVNYLTTKGFKATALAVGELPDLTDNENCANQRRVDVRLAEAAQEAPSRSCAPPPEFAALACLAEPPKKAPAVSSEQAAPPATPAETPAQQ